jgi:hypothetical protein
MSTTCCTSRSRRGRLSRSNSWMRNWISACRSGRGRRSRRTAAGSSRSFRPARASAT